MDCSCAPMLQFFSMASDGATTVIMVIIDGVIDWNNRTQSLRLFPANTASDCSNQLFPLCKISTPIFESCGAIYWRICEMFSALQSASGPVTDVENSAQKRCITGVAILPQTDTKLTKNAVLNLALCCGAIWRYREKQQYRCTITIHTVYNCSKKILENLPTRNLTLAM